MDLFLHNWYDKFLAELSITTNLRIISPFVKEQVIRKTSEKFNFSNFELITRFSLREFFTNVSSLDALRFSLENGATIYGIEDLHSKVYIFDNRAAIVTSANFTTGGMITNYECGLFLTDPNVIKSLHEYFDKLKTLAGKTLSADMCEDWQEQLLGAKVENIQALSFPDYGASEFLVDDTKRYYVKFFGTSNSRVPLDWTVKQEIDRALCHYACGFSRNKKPRQISDGDVIYLARMTHSPNNYSIFGKAEAIQFVDGRDEASPQEIEERKWKSNWPVYLRIRNPVFIDGTLGDGVFLYDLMNALDYESFPSTKL